MRLTKKVQICIGREYGSGGHAVAEKLGKDLNINVYDKNLISMIAKKHELDENALHDSDERLANPFFEPYSPYGVETGTISERLYMLQAEIIREEAAKGSSVFVGRCANDILRNEPNLVSLFIYAPKPYRIERIMRIEDIHDSSAAEKIIRRADKTRRAYYQFYTDKRWGTSEGMDLLLNSASLGVDGCVKAIEHYLVLRGMAEE